jgi:tRNA(Ser,Leu) C12 N-acetylase TAN1
MIDFAKLFRQGDDGKVIKLIKVFVPDAVVDGIIEAIGQSISLGFDDAFIGLINDKVKAAGIEGLVFTASNKEAMTADIDRFLATQINAKLGTNLVKLRGSTKDEILSEVGGVIERKVEGYGVQGLRLTNLGDRAAVIDDLDAFAAVQINAKLGTNLRRLRGSTKDELLEEVGRVIADRVNTETGSKIVTMYPVAKLRDELGTELIRQFDNRGRLAEGGLFPINRVLQTKAAFLKQVQIYKPVDAPVRTDAEELKAAANRARQKKYRRTHKAVYVLR